MIEHYNAFISYKHAELDNKVAEHVQKKLEHFHIPAKIQKQTGKKKIERVFRDKDELPITSDLTETISHALENADYLIVICSTNTKKSMWVKREIEFFLKTHDRSHILTVLCDGEPYDVIPEELTTQEKTVLDEDGNEVKITTSMEPLSCDYREGFRKGDKEELPRLASALIGCSYDELMNRRRQYRTRQMILIFSLVIVALIALGSYFFWTTKKIQDSLEAAKISQSRYYAGESMRLFDQDQRIKAIELALMALPSEDDPDRPIVPEAQRALTDSVFAYVTESSLNPGAVWSYSMTTDVVSIEVSENNKYLAARDRAGNIFVWDLAKKENVMQHGADASAPLRMFFVEDDTLIIIYSEILVAYDVPSGKEMWRNEGIYSYYAFEAPVTSDYKHIAITQEDDGIQYINAATGEVEKCYNPQFDSIHSFLPTVAYPNDDFSKYVVYGHSYDENNYYLGCIVGVYDTVSNKGYLLHPGSLYAYDFMWLSDTRVLVVMVPECNSTSYGNATLVSKDECELVCYDLEKEDVVWENKYEFSGDISRIGLFPIYTGDKVAFSISDNYVLLNVDDGSEIINCQVSSEILTVADRHNTGNIMAITTDGSTCALQEALGDSYYRYSVLPRDLIMAEVHDSLYLVQQNSNEIILFDFNIYDDNWTAITDEPIKISLFKNEQYRVGEGYVAIASASENVLRVYDTMDNKLQTTVEFSKYFDELDEYAVYDVLGIEDGKVYVYLTCYPTSAIVSVEIKSGKVEKLYDSTNKYVSDNPSVLQDDHIIFLDSTNYEGTTVGIYDIKKDKLKMIEVDTLYTSDYHDQENICLSYFDEINSFFYVNGADENMLYDIEAKKQKALELPDNWQGTSVVAVSPDGDVYVSDNTRIAVFDKSGKLKTIVPCTQGTARCIEFYTPAKAEDSLMLVITSTGYLCRYNTSDFSPEGYTKIEAFSDDYYNVYVNFDTERNCMYIFSNKVLSMVDMSSWYEVAKIENAIGHCNVTDRIYTITSKGSGYYDVGFFKRYTIEELIQMGKDILGDYQMSDEEKASYGG